MSVEAIVEHDGERFVAWAYVRLGVMDDDGKLPAFVEDILITTTDLGDVPDPSLELRRLAAEALRAEVRDRMERAKRAAARGFKGTT